ncbi:MAG: H-type lectin domain-containing protein, partial [Pseudomonadota bacterium]
MKRISNRSFGIQQGSRTLFSDFAVDGVMWTGQGEREIRQPVTFPEPFQAPPAVMVAIAMWDMDHNTNPRADIRSDNVTTTGFDIVFRTWSDTRIARIRADWTAIGTVQDDEVWEVV